MFRSIGVLLVAAGLVLLSPYTANADLVAGGDIVVLEAGNTASPQVPAALIRVDPVTGAQQIISDGGLLPEAQVEGFTFDPDTRSFLVLSDGTDRLIRVSALDGSQQSVTPFLIFGARSILVEPSGTYLISCLRAVIDGVDTPARLVRFDPTLGTVTEDFPIGFVADYMQLDGAGHLIAVDQHRVVRFTLSTGELKTIAFRGVHEEHFYGFALSGNAAFIAVSADGPPSGSDYVGRMDLETGQITPAFTGLQRVVDVAMDAYGRKLVLDQCQSQTPCAGIEVVYREEDEGDLAPLATNDHMFVASRMLVLPEPLVPPDSDDDGIRNSEDNCRNLSNPDQADTDGNGVGDACNDADDTDGDEWADPLDNCPNVPNVAQVNSDTDSFGDACDNCPAWENPDQSDIDGNGIGNTCECGDQSGDGRVNVVDLVAINLAVFNPAQAAPLCDTNDDDLCNVQDIVGANRKIFGQPAYCSRYPPSIP